jgi:hypothetical protein
VSSALDATRAWVDAVVVGLGLCPFASEVLAAGRVRLVESSARSGADLLGALDRELAHLLRTPVTECDTTLLVHPHALRDFVDYNDFLDVAEALLRERGCEGVVQIASFHPDYVFAGAPADDPANWTNRSPHPMLQLLREESIADAIAVHPDVAAIPVRNAARLRELGVDAVRARLERCGR